MLKTMINYLLLKFGHWLPNFKAHVPLPPMTEEERNEVLSRTFDRLYGEDK